MTQRGGTDVLGGRQIAVSVVVVAIAFICTWLALDYIGQRGRAPTPDPGLKPANTWSVIDGASYAVKDGVITMHGPQSIYREALCKAATCTATFSLFVTSADAANLGLLFLNEAGTAIQNATVKTISGARDGTLTLQARTPPGTKTVRCLVYAPTATDSVSFRNAQLTVAPAP